MCLLDPTVQIHFGSSDFKSFNSQLKAQCNLPEASDLSPRVSLDLTVQISSALQLFDSSALRRFGSSALSTSALWLSGTSALRLFSSPALRLFDSLALRLFSSLVLQLFGSPGFSSSGFRSLNSYTLISHGVCLPEIRDLLKHTSPSVQRPRFTSVVSPPLLVHKLPKLWILRHLSSLTMDSPQFLWDFGALTVLSPAYSKC
jgi:hypothetical protein